MNIWLKGKLLSGLLLSTLCVSIAVADSVWPSDAPISYVVPYPPGGSTDILARRIAHFMNQDLGTSVVVENKSGGSGTVGGGSVARSKPDGHTVLHTTIGPQSIVPHFQKLTYDPSQSLQPVVLVGTFPHVLVVSSTSPYKSISDLASASKKSTPLFFSSSGAGTILHMQGELLKLKVGIDATHIPYKGDTPALQAVISGEVSFAFIPVVAALPHIQAGKLRPIAVTAKEPIESLNGVPTMAQQGVSDFIVEQWQGVYVPKGTSTKIVEALNKSINGALQTSEIRALAERLKIAIAGGTPDALEQRQQEDFIRWGTVIERAKLK